MSAVHTIARRYLQEGPASVQEVATVCGCSYEYARRVVRELRAPCVRVARVSGLFGARGWIRVRIFDMREGI